MQDKLLYSPPAENLDFIPFTFINFGPGVNPVSNLSVPLIFDDEVEDMEMFEVGFAPFGTLPNVIMDPSMTNVTILDSTGM